MHRLLAFPLALLRAAAARDRPVLGARLQSENGGGTIFIDSNLRFSLVSLIDQGGDRVKGGRRLGTSAALLGPIHVDQNTHMGSGAAVLSDAPPGATVVGVSTRIAAHQTQEHAATSCGDRPVRPTNAAAVRLERQASRS